MRSATRSEAPTDPRCRWTVVLGLVMAALVAPTFDPAYADCTADDCRNGLCQGEPAPACDDGDPCTVGDVCANGVCAGQPRDCAEAPIDDPCTIDTCQNQGGEFLCVHTSCLDVPQGCGEEAPLCRGECGDGVVQPGESCDPPDATIDPATGQPKCRPDCTYCGDGVVDFSDGETCDDGNRISGCDPTHPGHSLDLCLDNCTEPICQDPAKITHAPLADRFDFHGRLVTATTLDFPHQDFVLRLTDPNGGVIFGVVIGAGGITGDRDTGKFRYVDRAAKTRGGVAELKITRHAGTSYRVTAQSYGDLSGAQADMVTHAHLGAEEWTLAGRWERTMTGWRYRGR